MTQQEREKILDQIVGDFEFSSLVDRMYTLARGAGESPEDFVTIRINALGFGAIEVNNYVEEECLSRTHFNYPEDFE
jgi:hypothetical protein